MHSHLARGWTFPESLQRLACVVLAVAGVMSCSNSHPSNVASCVPGASVSCVGPASCAGYQLCGQDGTYGACVCGTDAGATSDADQDALGVDATTGADATIEAGRDGGSVDARSESLDGESDGPLDSTSVDAASAPTSFWN